MLGIPANERVSPPNIDTDAQTQRNLPENLSGLGATCPFLKGAEGDAEEIVRKMYPYVY